MSRYSLLNGVHTSMHTLSLAFHPARGAYVARHDAGAVKCAWPITLVTAAHFMDPRGAFAP